MTPPTDITLLTEPRYARLQPDDWYQGQIATEEGLLAEALRALGLSVARRAWSDPDMDWRQTRCAVFRSTWDYFDRIDAFAAWLDRVEPLTRLENPAPTIRWNMDKHYLAELQAAGVAIVPTAFLPPRQPVTLAALMDARGWAEVVVKPAVSGGARLTWRVARADAARHQPELDRCLAREAMLVQPFEPAILSSGELSLMVIDGACTHAVRKTARAGDFRVQDDHGGTVAAHTAAADEIAFAHQAVAACPGRPAYARVDLVRSDAGLRLMEVELVEPELFLRFHPPAAQALAQALAHRLADR
jgi:glutathione synthase/RimK-type ligase-like ATP-grasp enzyme